MVRSLSSGLKVAARLSPPLSDEHDVGVGELAQHAVDGLRLMEQSSRMAVGGSRRSPRPGCARGQGAAHGEQALVSWCKMSLVMAMRS